MKVYPVGYSERQAGELLDSLMSSSSTLLIDIRYAPWSQRPEWRKEALEQKYGARYRSAGRYLGNVNYQGGGSIRIANAPVGIRGLCKYLAEGHDLVLLCACKEYEQCHRKTVIDLLQQQLPTVEVVPSSSLLEAQWPARMALTISQPYACMLVNPEVFEVHGIPPKRVECRSWTTRYRGPLLLHAGKGFDQDALPYWIRRFPMLADMMPLEQKIYDVGGIVGIADLIDIVTESADPWFFGKYGWVLANARSLPFVPCAGQPSLFSVSLDLDLEGVK